MTEEQQVTKTELLSRIEAGWGSLNQALSGLTESDLTRINPRTGWVVKDHLAHLAAWERGIGNLLSRRPRYEGMGITAYQWRDLTMDEINEVIFQEGHKLTAAESLVRLRQAHSELLDALATLDDSDLLRDYAEYDVDGAFPGRPIVGWIVGNTYEHYREHLDYIHQTLNG